MSIWFGLKSGCDSFEVWYVPRLNNLDADHLAWITSSRAPTLLDVIIEMLSKPSVKSVESVSEVNQVVIDEPDQEPVYDWIHPIKMFLENYRCFFVGKNRVVKIAHSSFKMVL
jgi:hypothetical protein